MTDTNPGAWDGRPQDPDRDGWHWVQPTGGEPFPAEWRTAGECVRGRWGEGWVVGPDEYDPAQCAYLGPCHTPAELAALVEAARREEREACEAVVSHRAKLARNMQETARGKDEAAYWQNRASALELGAAAIRARGDA